MKERPILFSTPMVKAIMEGRKTVTRRLIDDYSQAILNDINGKFELRHTNWYDEEEDKVHSPEWVAYDQEEDHVWPLGQLKGNIGDRLWVRETFNGKDVQYLYKADCNGPTDLKWKPSIFMPKEAARIWVEITSVKVERLNSITEEQAIAEGLTKISKDGRTWKYGIPDLDGLPGTDNIGWPWTKWDVDPVKAYATLWEDINGEGSWAKNPWVCAISFKVLSTTGRP